MSFADQVVLITGAASGIGRQLALTLAGQGAAIAAVDIQEGPLKTLETELAGKPFAAAAADVTDRPGLEAAVGRLRERLGPVDLLIASAGVGIETSALFFQAADFEKVIRVNLVGVANSIAAVLPEMLRRRRGHLVALSSLASFRGLPNMAGYCASKAGLNALMESVRVEVAPHGIAVTTICPGWVRTPMTARISAALSDMLEVEDAVRRMVAAIGKRRPFVAFPRSTAFRCRLLRWLPTRVGDWLVRRLVARMTRRSKPA
jgi:NAD(P)-dependent dehydrogenase (short-subunit alcohol dehydrogenase family)